MEEFLTFPNPRLPSTTPVPDSLLVSLVDDQGTNRYPIPNPLTSNNFTDRLDGALAITGLNRVRETLSAPYNVPENRASRETWLRHLFEVLVGAHEGLRNTQQANADRLPDAFSDLNTEEANTASHIHSVLTDLIDFFDLVNEPDENSPTRTHCIRCIESASLPPPSSIPEHITSLLLTCESDARAARLSILNDRIRQITHEADDWCKAQTAALNSFLILHLVSTNPSPEQMASALGADPSFNTWAKRLGNELREYTRKVICNEVGQDTSDQRCVEIMQTHMTEATRNATTYVKANQDDINKKSAKDIEEFRAKVAADTERKFQELRDEAEKHLANLKAELDAGIEQETLRLRRDARTTITNLTDQHDLVTVARSKDRPSPLSTKPRKVHRKRKTGTYAGPLQPGTLQPSDESEAMATDDQLTDLEPASPLPLPPSLPISTTSITAQHDRTPQQTSFPPTPPRVN